MSDRKSEFATLISSKLTPFLIAFFVFVHCMYSLVKPPGLFTSLWVCSLVRAQFYGGLTIPCLRTPSVTKGHKFTVLFNAAVIIEIFKH